MNYLQQQQIQIELRLACEDIHASYKYIGIIGGGFPLITHTTVFDRKKVYAVAIYSKEIMNEFHKTVICELFKCRLFMSSTAYLQKTLQITFICEDHESISTLQLT